MVTIDGYEIDVAIREEHAFENEITEHPVEQGADIVDHVRARPIVVTLEGCVSDTPIGDLATRRSETTLPSREAFDRLLAVRNARLPVTIATSLRVYTDMILESLTTPRDATTGDALAFTARFRQIRLVEVTRVAVDIPRVQGKTNRGNKPSPTAADAKITPPKKLESFLFTGGNKAVQLLKEIL